MRIAPAFSSRTRVVSGWSATQGALVNWRKIPIARFDLQKGEQTAQAYENACLQPLHGNLDFNSAGVRKFPGARRQ